MKKIFAIALIATLFTGCAKTIIAPTSSMEPTFIRDGLNGTIVVKCSGTGEDRDEAIKQAEKNAVYQAIFKGFPTSTNNMRPIAGGVNVRENNEEFFNDFFSKRGNYRRYVSTIDKDKKSTQGVKNREAYTVFTTVEIDITDLRDKLIDKGVIK